MRRLLVALIALAVLAPSASAGMAYRCRFDRFVRIACCCPAAGTAKQPRVVPDAVVRAQCCRVTQPDPAAQPSPPGVQPVDEQQQLLAATAAVPTVGVVPPARPMALARSHAVPDPPPRSLFSRHCALLL